MNFTNCHVTIHSINNYATVTVSDPSNNITVTVSDPSNNITFTVSDLSNNTTFDISASNVYSPYCTYQTTYGYYNGSNVCCHPVYNSFGPTGLLGKRISSGPSSSTGMTGTTNLSDVTRSMYSYYN